jgi:hypothetical protein
MKLRSQDNARANCTAGQIFDDKLELVLRSINSFILFLTKRIKIRIGEMRWISEVGAMARLP